MGIKITYKNIESAKRGMRKRGIRYAEGCAPHRTTERPKGIHFDLDSAHVVRYTNKPEVVVEYYYFNLRNQPGYCAA